MACLPQDEAGGGGRLLLFGGRRQGGLLLNDVWSGRVEAGPNGTTIAWTLLHDPQAGVGTGGRAG